MKKRVLPVSLCLAMALSLVCQGQNVTADDNVLPTVVVEGSGEMEEPVEEEAVEEEAVEEAPADDGVAPVALVDEEEANEEVNAEKPVGYGRVELNVHVLVDGEKQMATDELSSQLQPVLEAEDGTKYEPTKYANGFRFEFEQIPAGEYTLLYTYPKEYTFVEGEVGSEMFGLYSDTGKKVTVENTPVWQQLYTRFEKVPEEPEETQPEKPVGKGRVHFNIHVKTEDGRGMGTEDLLTQMHPVLIAADGTEYEPTSTYGGYRFVFEQLPAGEYKLVYDYPEGYTFVPGAVGSAMFGDYSDTNATVTVPKTSVVQPYYTLLEKVPEETEETEEPSVSEDPEDTSEVTEETEESTVQEETTKAPTKAEEQKAEKAPQTGDHGVALWASLLVAAGALFTTLRKRNEDRAE